MQDNELKLLGGLGSIQAIDNEKASIILLEGINNKDETRSFS